MPTENGATLEQTQQGVSMNLEHAEYDESNTYVLERFNTSAGNPVKEILLKLNLSDHRLLKWMVEVPDPAGSQDPKHMLITRLGQTLSTS
ncbi:hypothetical protein Tco_0856457 [Tanacetum coccineum]|uniref:Uncharacterized protein n=1 Tax=Tanacetum coccineum TaxID=301880 RepID=A0ABQ5B3V2_9ASTR